MAKWEKEYKKQFMDYMKDGALFLSIRNFFRRVVTKARIMELELIKSKLGQLESEIIDNFINERIAELEKEINNETCKG